MLKYTFFDWFFLFFKMGGALFLVSVFYIFLLGFLKILFSEEKGK